MFSFNSLHKGSLASKSPTSRNHNGFSTLRRFFARSAFVLIALSALLVFSGCPTEATSTGGTGFVLEGKWVSPYDSYTITKTTVDYFMDNSEWDTGNTILKGTIEKSVAFSGNAGVLIIKVTESQDDYNPFTVGNYAGVYYKEGTTSTIKMGNALKSDYSPLETTTLSDAEALFIEGNADTHISMWGSYTR